MAATHRSEAKRKKSGGLCCPLLGHIGGFRDLGVYNVRVEGLGFRGLGVYGFRVEGFWGLCVCAGAQILRIMESQIGKNNGQCNGECVCMGAYMDIVRL